MVRSLGRMVDLLLFEHLFISTLHYCFSFLLFNFHFISLNLPLSYPIFIFLLSKTFCIHFPLVWQVKLLLQRVFNKPYWIPTVRSTIADVEVYVLPYCVMLYFYYFLFFVN